METNTLFEMGMTLILVGFVIAFISSVLLTIRGNKVGSKLKGGGIVMLGPFPIVFGTDKSSMKTLIVLAIVLMGLSLVFTLLIFQDKVE